jgi:predicted ArsR family transcriptional regulator
VARLHLSKLEDIGLLESDFQKGAMAGRPGKTYHPKEQGVSLSFPPRDYHLLSSLVLETLSGMGEDGLRILKQIGRAYGRKIIEEGPTDGLSSMELVKNIFQEQGLCPEMQNNMGEKTGTMQISFRNCSFLEAACQFPHQVCIA